MRSYDYDMSHPPTQNLKEIVTSSDSCRSRIICSSENMLTYRAVSVYNWNESNENTIATKMNRKNLRTILVYHRVFSVHNGLN